MAIYDFFLSRNNGPTLQNYVGHNGRLFYDSDEKVLRVADGVTPGGFPVTPTTLVSTTEPTVVAEGQMWYNPTTLELWCYHNGNFEPTIDLATETKIGGVKLGPGVITNNEGQIIIDSSGLEFSFGDFSAIDNKLSTVNSDQDAIILSNGTGSIRAVGKFYIHPTNGEVDDYTSEPFLFGVGTDGQVKIFVPTPDDTTGAVEIIGSLTGITQTPVNTGVMLHITGQNNDPARLYVDGISGYSGWIGRRFNGSSSLPTQVLANDEVMRLGANAFKTGGWSGVGSSNIRFVSTDNQTNTAQGMKIDFYSTPQGSPTSSIVKVMTLDGGIGVTTPVAFNGPGTGLTGTAANLSIGGTAATATNLAAASNILAGSISINPTIINRSTASVQTFTLSGLTTSHKVVITSGTAFGYGVFISAAWASASNTLSIEFQNYLGNTDVDLTDKTINYYAWI